MKNYFNEGLVPSIIYSFAIAEGRLSKEQIFKEGNKEIFYRMKNNGYIKETVKGSGILTKRIY